MNATKIFKAMCLFAISVSLFACTTTDGNLTLTTEEEILDGEMDTNSQDVTYENAVLIAYSLTGVDITNPFDSDGVSISESNGNVVVTSTNTSTEINYVLSGTTTAGALKIYSDLKFGLILNGVDITSTDGPAINIQSKKKASVTLVTYTNNRLIDTETYTAYNDEDMKGTFFSEGKLAFDGAGSLIVLAKYKHAIASDDNLEISDGTFNIVTYAQKGAGLKGDKVTITDADKLAVTVKGNGSKAISASEDMRIDGGTITLTTTGSAFWDSDDSDITSAAGIKCDANLTINNGTLTILSSGSGGKGINVDSALVINNGTIAVTTTGGQFVYGSDDTAAKAVKSDGNLTVNDGSISIKTSGVEAEGLESKATLVINGGTIEIEAYDDCINASTHIAINGGRVFAQSAVNDAIDSNGTLTITGGTIVAVGSVAPEAGFDCDQSRFAITGGVLLGIGGSTSSPTASASSQYAFVYNNSGSANELINVQANGTSLFTYLVPRTFSQMALLFSSSAVASNTAYTIYKGGSIANGSDFHGLYLDGSYSSGSVATTFTTSSIVTTIGSSSNPNGGNGGRP